MPLYELSENPEFVHSLIFQAREHCQAVRNAFLLLLMFQLTLCLLQLLDAILMLPPIFSTHHVIWLVLVTLPLMTVSMMGSPRDNSIMKKALGKNKKHLTKQVFHFFPFSSIFLTKYYYLYFFLIRHLLIHHFSFNSSGPLDTMKVHTNAKSTF